MARCWSVTASAHWGPRYDDGCSRRLARQGAGVASLRQHLHQQPAPAPPAAHLVPRGLWRPAAVCCAATKLQTAAQELSAAEPAEAATEAAGSGSGHHTPHSGLDTAPAAEVLTGDDAAAAERRASGWLASTSAGGTVEPVAVARCHTLAAEVCCLPGPATCARSMQQECGRKWPLVGATFLFVVLHEGQAHAGPLAQHADVLRRGGGGAQSRGRARWPPVRRLRQRRRAMGGAAAAGRQRPPVAAGTGTSGLHH